MSVLGIIACHCGELDEGERVVRPLKELGPPAVDLVGEEETAFANRQPAYLRVSSRFGGEVAA